MIQCAKSTIRSEQRRKIREPLATIVRSQAFKVAPHKARSTAGAISKMTTFTVDSRARTISTTFTLTSVVNSKQGSKGAAAPTRMVGISTRPNQGNANSGIDNSTNRSRRIEDMITTMRTRSVEGHSSMGERMTIVPIVSLTTTINGTSSVRRAGTGQMAMTNGPVSRQSKVNTKTLTGTNLSKVVTERKLMLRGEPTEKPSLASTSPVKARPSTRPIEHILRLTCAVLGKSSSKVVIRSLLIGISEERSSMGLTL